MRSISDIQKTQTELDRFVSCLKQSTVNEYQNN